MAEQPVDLHGRRILIVEDEVIIAFGIECEVRAAGGEIVGPAHNIEEAMALIDDGIDAAILDVDIGGEPIWRVADRLSAQNIPFLFATASSHDIGALVPRHADAPRFGKPTVMGQLLASLVELVTAPNSQTVRS